MERKLKHLEFIQGVINRLSTNSFLLKGWSVVLVSALLALSGNYSNIVFTILAYFPTIIFWGLDGYFLALEREYRNYYELVSKKDVKCIDFSMSLKNSNISYKSWCKAVLSKTLIPFHGSLIASIIIFMLVIKK